MARIRTVKPEVWTDPEFVSCSPLARLLWIGTWNHADDYGVLKDDPERLQLQILPSDECDPHALVEELVQRRCLLRKVARDGTKVLVIRTFCLHQKIDRRAVGRWGSPDDFTDPPESPRSRPSTTDPHQSPPIPTNPAGSPQSPTDPHHTNGKEGNGREGNPSRAPARSSGLALVPDVVSSPAATVTAGNGRYPPDFLAWWELYPRKQAKAAAAKAWCKARTAASFDQLVDGLRAACEVWARGDPRYIPHPASWLNGQRWEDDFTVPPRRPKGFDGIEAALRARGSA